MDVFVFTVAEEQLFSELDEFSWLTRRKKRAVSLGPGVSSERCSRHINDSWAVPVVPRENLWAVNDWWFLFCRRLAAFLTRQSIWRLWLSLTTVWYVKRAFLPYGSIQTNRSGFRQFFSGFSVSVLHTRSINDTRARSTQGTSPSRWWILWML